MSKFVLRTEDGKIITSNDVENFGQEETYETKTEAEQALKRLEVSIPRGLFKVVKN